MKITGMKMSIYNIIQELNLENGSNYKMGVLRKHADNTLLQRVLKMTYDKVDFTYGVTMKNVSTDVEYKTISISLASALDILEHDFSVRLITGNDALRKIGEMLNQLSTEDGDILAKILTRDLRINMGRSNINKVFKGLIVKPVYMRCGLFKNGKKSKINPEGSIVQLKADGTYREFTVENGAVICNSRSGESYDYPILNQTLETYPDGHYIGELTVRLADGAICNRATGNGFIKSMKLPEGAAIVLDLWDYVTLEEYTNAANKIKGFTPYHRRLTTLALTVLKDKHLSPMPHAINVIETHVINTITEAMQHCAAWMEAGLEGGIWKDKDAIFRDGTSPQQEKMKLEIDADVRITGFTEGTKGTVREHTFGAITFENDEGTVKGQTSGFNDSQLKDFNSRRDELIGKIMSVQFNDVTKGRTNEYYALSHPRFIEIRNDKDSTDTLERILESKEMAMNFV
jgi:DNA ligase-1